ncbi:expressed unknown protein [Ectocarpus siliculosus]|uniref:Uncharacterized protein n=1 Tax=Ectocarpus siliculosus TaxID=2880 RepID=D8LGZ0_ECTSI|nr:expressed unknown protein [Ectocarpus siliculosus]|eukprot:CBN75843.1 expressed unknown protein [Ectocarpus siliculosus]
MIDRRSEDHSRSSCPSVHRRYHHHHHHHHHRRRSLRHPPGACRPRRGGRATTPRSEGSPAGTCARPRRPAALGAGPPSSGRPLARRTGGGPSSRPRGAGYPPSPP